MELNRQNKQESDLPLGLSKPALRALTNYGFTQLEQISTISETKLKQLHGIGPKAVEQLRYALEMKGLTFSKK